MKINKFSLVIFGLLLILMGGNVFAQGPVSLKISPLTFKYTLEKGKEVSDIVRIINPNQFPLEIESEKEDFFMADEEGSPSFLPQGGKMSLASWIKIGLEKFSLAPLETKEIPFTISLPKDAEPGGHYGAIFFKTQPSLKKGQTQIGIASRVGALILVSVLGEISQKGEIIEFKARKFLDKGPVSFFVRFKNTGTVHYEPRGKITILNWFGKKVAELSLPKHTVLPESIRRFETTWQKRYLFGKYQAQLEVFDGEGISHKKAVSFFVFPWQESLIILGGLLAIWQTLSFLKKRYKVVKK